MERAVNILSAIFDSFDDVWFFISPDYSIKYFNQKAFNNGKALHGKELKAGDSILDYAKDTTNKVDQTFIDNFNRALKGEALKVDQHIQYHSLSIWTRSKYTPVYEKGELLGISVVVEDITTQKQGEEERERQQEEIIKLSTKREEFINIASHELKTPLTSLKASIQIISKLLNDGVDQQEIKMFLEKSSLNVVKLTNLIGALLNANKITNGQLVLQKSWFNLYSLCESCCDHLRLEKKHVIEIIGPEDLKVFADKEKIDQVITNLINNAAKHAPKSFHIIIRLEEEPEQIKVSVQDFGPGIPKENTDNLFKRYYQGEKKDYKGGMGLGLYIAEGIIKQHDGFIGFETQKGQGSTFWFTLPIADD